MKIRQSFCLPCYSQGNLSRPELLAAAKKIGYEATEIWDRTMYADWEALFDQARSAGLAIASMCGHTSLGDGLNNPGNHDRIEGELKESIDLAVRHGIPGLICFSGNRRKGQSDDEGMTACAEGLRRIAPYAEENGINLNIELLNSKKDHPGYQCDHTDWGTALCREVNSPRVKLLYDIYHMQIMEGDIINTIRVNIDRIGHFHTAGNPGRKDMDDTQELNYRGICSAIAQSGFDLFVAHEFSPKGDPVAALAAAFTLCDVS